MCGGLGAVQLDSIQRGQDAYEFYVQLAPLTVSQLS